MRRAIAKSLVPGLLGSMLGLSGALAGCDAGVPTIPDAGNPGCAIEGGTFAAGDLNPADRCQICNPSLTTGAWTSQPDLTDCSASGAGTYCQLGRCVNGCGIGGLVVLAGAANADDPCLICAPRSVLDAWSRNPDCSPDAGPPDGGEPDAGPDAGDAGPEGCTVGGATFAAGELTGPCQACNPTVSTSSGQPLADGTACDAGGNVCLAGACIPGCSMDGGVVPAHQFQSLSEDSCCNPAVSASAWTPGFVALPAISISGATSLAAAAFTGSNAQLVVGTSLGGVTRITELPDGGFAEDPIVSGAAAIRAVAAADVSGDGLMDLLYLDTTAPTLLPQLAGGAFGTPKTWPPVYDGGGLWAEMTPYGAQVISFDPRFSTSLVLPFSSYLQPQVDASGHLLDGCQATVAECAPIGLAFGSIRTRGATELVMTCFQSAGHYETLYGTYNPASCGDGGWEVDQFIPEDFSTGAVIGPVVAAGDLNGDGYSEVVGGGQLEVDLLLNWGPSNGTFLTGRTSVPIPPGSNVKSLQIANLRGDAGGAILALDTGNNALEVFYPPPPYDAGVPLTASYPAMAAGSALAVGDFNGDGRPDVAVQYSGGVRIYQRQCP